MRKWIITGFGTGYLPIAPGTWGSAAVSAVFLLVAWLSGGSVLVGTVVMAGIAALASAAGVAWGRLAENQFGRKDPSECTIDEWAGQALTYLLLPLGTGWGGWLIAAGVGLLMFRLFDIVKPQPARAFQNYRAGWGIVADDLVAGFYANLASQVILWSPLWLRAAGLISPGGWP